MRFRSVDACATNQNLSRLKEVILVHGWCWLLESRLEARHWSIDKVLVLPY
jgi:hypothetical protein